MPEMPEGAPDGLVNTERMRILDERGKEELQRLLRTATRREMSRQREPRAPILRGFLDDPPAQMRESIWRAGSHRERFEPIERKVGAIRRDVHERFPDLRRLTVLALRNPDVA